MYSFIRKHGPTWNNTSPCFWCSAEFTTDRHNLVIRSGFYIFSGCLTKSYWVVVVFFASIDQICERVWGCFQNISVTLYIRATIREDCWTIGGQCLLLCSWIICWISVMLVKSVLQTTTQLFNCFSVSSMIFLNSCLREYYRVAQVCLQITLLMTLNICVHCVLIWAVVNNIVLHD